MGAAPVPHPPVVPSPEYIMGGSGIGVRCRLDEETRRFAGIRADPPVEPFPVATPQRWMNWCPAGLGCAQAQALDGSHPDLYQSATLSPDRSAPRPSCQAMAPPSRSVPRPPSHTMPSHTMPSHAPLKPIRATAVQNRSDPLGHKGTGGRGPRPYYRRRGGAPSTGGSVRTRRHR